MTTKISFALEYTLGHVTHAENLKKALQGAEGVLPTYFDIPFENTPLPAPWSMIGPIRDNWTARASIVAYNSIKKTLQDADCAFFHTQITSIFSAGLMRRLPSIVSLDATPIQYDSLGAVYNHASGASSLESIKKRLNQRAFDAAKALITWSEWTRKSLVNDYGIEAGKIIVIPPGIDLNKWKFNKSATNKNETRLLFVGGDFLRKGGDILVKSFEEVTKRNANCFLDIVTKDTNIQNLPQQVTVHNGLRPNTPELLQLYANADVFVFPTRGDMLPLAVLEAMAAGIPVITTNIGALSEVVVDGATGSVVPMDDVEALTSAIDRLVSEPDFRRSLGSASRERAEQHYDALVNYPRILGLLQSLKP